mmetsp:Transcript_8934/g.25973  ORF Transcript_8934/g.25973 Transcript_8934/m.25973 type:complete len:213 (+) Transcript_8934:262-900(+)
MVLLFKLGLPLIERLDGVLDALLRGCEFAIGVVLVRAGGGDAHDAVLDGSMVSHARRVDAEVASALVEGPLANEPGRHGLERLMHGLADLHVSAVAVPHAHFVDHAVPRGLVGVRADAEVCLRVVDGLYLLLLVHLVLELVVHSPVDEDAHGDAVKGAGDVVPHPGLDLRLHLGGRIAWGDPEVDLGHLLQVPLACAVLGEAEARLPAVVRL